MIWNPRWPWSWFLLDAHFFYGDTRNYAEVRPWENYAGLYEASDAWLRNFIMGR